MEILLPGFECVNSFVLREGPLFWSSVGIHTLPIKNSEVLMRLCAAPSSLNHRID